MKSEQVLTVLSSDAFTLINEPRIEFEDPKVRREAENLVQARPTVFLTPLCRGEETR